VKRQLGPLKLYQWIMIGAIVGVGTYLYNKRKGSTTSNVAPTDSGTLADTTGNTDAGSPTSSGTGDLGPVDPSTGLPYAWEYITSQMAQPQSMSNLPGYISPDDPLWGVLADIAGQQPATGGAAASAAGNNGAAHVAAVTGAKPKLTAKGAMYAPFGHNKPATKAGYTIKGLGRGFWEYVPIPKKVTRPPGNPGHTATPHASGKQTISSSAPHNGNQHKSIAPPSHQKAPTPKPAQHHTATAPKPLPKPTPKPVAKAVPKVVAPVQKIVSKVVTPPKPAAKAPPKPPPPKPPPKPPPPPKSPPKPVAKKK